MYVPLSKKSTEALLELVSELNYISDCNVASRLVPVVKNPPASAGDVRDLGSIPELGRPPGGSHGNLLQYSCLENPDGQRSLVGYSPWRCKESDMTEVLELATND